MNGLIIDNEIIKRKPNNLNKATSVIWNKIEELKIKLQEEFKQLSEIPENNTGLNEMIGSSLIQFIQDIHDKSLERDYQLKMLHEEGMKKIEFYYSNLKGELISLGVNNVVVENSTKPILQELKEKSKIICVKQEQIYDIVIEELK
jgi:hypothetical protein